MIKLTKKMLLGVAISTALMSSAFAGKVEVLHYWTSGGEAAAAAELKLVSKIGRSWIY